MHDEEIISIDAHEDRAAESDPLPTLDPQVGDIGANDSEPDEASADNDPAKAPAIFDGTVQDPDPGTAPPAPQAEADRLEQLRGELNSLRQELNRQQGLFARLGRECEEFDALFPEVPLTELPDSVWSDVERGIPLAAAYALFDRRRQLTAQNAERSNLENRQRSAGGLEPTENDYYSPAEVRAMSRDEVRKHYTSIMRSMQKWH